MTETEYRDRAHAAEWDLSDIRCAVWDLIEWLRDPSRGGRVIYRSDVADRLERILGR